MARPIERPVVSAFTVSTSKGTMTAAVRKMRVPTLTACRSTPVGLITERWLTALRTEPPGSPSRTGNRSRDLPDPVAWKADRLVESASVLPVLRYAFGVN